jgi:hypothetical protein
MAGKHDYQGFNFVPQKDTQTILQEQISSSFQQRPNSVIIRNVKQNPNHWRIDEVIVSGKREMSLVHHSVLGETAVDLDSQPVYLPQRFNQSELTEINQVLGISKSSTSDKKQEKRVGSEKETVKPNSKNNSNLGTISLITGILALAGLGIYRASSIVKKSKKIKK